MRSSRKIEKPTVEVHEEEAPVAAIEQKNRFSQDMKPPSPQKKLQQQAHWQPKLNNMQGGNKGSKGVNQVWVAKEEKGSTGNGAESGRKGKTKGKGNNTTEQWRMKQSAQQEASTTRQINQRGKKNQRNTVCSCGSFCRTGY